MTTLFVHTMTGMTMPLITPPYTPPSWCANRLHIQGTPAQIRELQRYFEGSHLDFARVLPVPSHTTDVLAWKKHHWGAYGPCQEYTRQWTVSHNETEAFEYTFQTLDTPPLPVIRTLCQQLGVEYTLYYLNEDASLGGWEGSALKSCQLHGTEVEDCAYFNTLYDRTWN